MCLCLRKSQSFNLSVFKPVWRGNRGRELIGEPLENSRGHEQKRGEVAVRILIHAVNAQPGDTRRACEFGIAYVGSKQCFGINHRQAHSSSTARSVTARPATARPATARPATAKLRTGKKARRRKAQTR